MAVHPSSTYDDEDGNEAHHELQSGDDRVGLCLITSYKTLVLCFIIACMLYLLRSVTVTLPSGD